MVRRLAMLGGMIAIGLVLSGCTRCGPIWDDWMQSPKSCKSDHL
ncbi:peptidylprolyl isomerase [Bradyrhizobium sp. 26S5]